MRKIFEMLYCFSFLITRINVRLDSLKIHNYYNSFEIRLRIRTKFGLNNPHHATCLIERQQMQIKSTIAENGREKRVQSDRSR